MKPIIGAFFLLGALLVCNQSAAHGQTTPPKIGARLVLAQDKVQAGRLISAALIIDIPPGYHLNAHEPISRFALPTKIEVQVPDGYKIGPISYPRAVVRKFSFTDERLGVYEKQAVIRFSLRIPSNEQQRTTTVKAILSYQSCSNEVCFPPKKQEAMVVFKVT
jgi:DsbC/DsbD-like thiol-disulfide interchange protein